MIHANGYRKKDFPFKMIMNFGCAFLIFTLASITSQLSAQKFHFGASAGFIASQVDGDNLIGFNKFGYQAGLISGYSFTESSWMLVELQYAEFGSSLGDEDVERNLELDLSSINVLAAYSLRFGDSWDGHKKFRVVVGPKFQRIIKASGPNIPKSAIREMFISVNIGLSYTIAPPVLIDLTYTHGLQNILTEPLSTSNSLIPYYLTLGVSYYINKKD